MLLYELLSNWLTQSPYVQKATGLNRHVQVFTSEINNYTTAVTSQKAVNSNIRAVFSTRSVSKCYKQSYGSFSIR
jgi:hypothetical protein